MPYNFETNTGTVYVGNTAVPGLGFLDSMLGGVYTGAVLDPGSSYFIGAPITRDAIQFTDPFKNFRDWVNNAGQTVSDTVQAGNSLTTGLGVLSGSLGLVILGGGAYLLAKNQKWIK